jgi:hypothetical protein
MRLRGHAQLRNEVAPYRAAISFALRRRRVAAAASRSPLGRWTGWIGAYVRARVGRALGVADPAAIAALLCRHHARVRTTATHVDVTFALAALPISVRLAGLDRTPGWIPSADRIVTFHFD